MNEQLVFTVICNKILRGKCIGNTVIVEANGTVSNLSVYFNDNNKSFKIGAVTNEPDKMLKDTKAATYHYKELLRAFKNDDKLEFYILDSKTDIINGKEISLLKISNMKDIEPRKKASDFESNTEEFLIKFKGTASKYPFKSKVIDGFKNSKIIIVSFLLINNGLIANFDGGHAGIDDDSIDARTLKDLISNDSSLLNLLSGKVIDATTMTFTVSVKLKKTYISNSKKKMNDSIESIINKEFVDNKEYVKTAKEIFAYLKENDFTLEQIEDIFKMHKTFDKSVQYRVPAPKNFYFDSGILLKTGYAGIKFNRPLLCKGNKSTGKNKYIETLAWIFQKPLYTFSVNGDVDKFDLLGSKSFETKVNDKGQEFTSLEFKPDILIEAMQVGGMFNLDEINFADPSILALFHSIADDQRKIQVAGYKEVICSKDFILIGSMNEKYFGTKKLNSAFNDRFIPLLFDYPASIRDILINKNLPVESSNIDLLDNIYGRLLSSVRSGARDLTEECLSIRRFEHALELSSILPVEEALVTCLVNKLSENKQKDAVRTLLKIFL